MIRQYSWFLKIVKIAIFATAVYFMASLVAERWSLVATRFCSVTYIPLTVSIGIALIGNLVMASFFKALLARYGLLIDAIACNRLLFFGQIAKYVPGKIWVLVSQRLFIGIKNASYGLLMSNFDIMIFSYLYMVSVALALLAIPYYYGLASLACMTAGCMGSLMVLRNNLLASCSHKVWARFVLSTEELKVSDRPLSITRIVIYFLASSISYFASTSLMLNAVMGYDLMRSADFVSNLALAWVGGSLVFILPAGLGVREFIFIHLGAMSVGGYSADELGTIAVVSRMWMISIDIIGAGLVFLFQVCNKNSRLMARQT